jgi:hypothetical protein
MTKRSEPNGKKGSKRFALVILAGTLFPMPTPASPVPPTPIAGPVGSPGASSTGTEFVRPAPAPSPAAPSSPENKDLDGFAEEQRQQREENEVTEKNLERAHVAEERHGVEVSGPPASEDPDRQARLARAERFGDAITALDVSDTGVAEAEQRLVDAQAAEESVKHDPAATELDRAAARFATSDAQAALTHAQSGRDQADMELRDARGDGPRDRNAELVRDAPGPEALGEEATAKLRAVGERAGTGGQQTEDAIRQARTEEMDRMATATTPRDREIATALDVGRATAAREAARSDLSSAVTDLDAKLDGHLGELNHSLYEARNEVNQLASDADREAAAERLQVMSDRHEAIEQVTRDPINDPFRRPNEVAFVPPEVVARVEEVNAEASRRQADIDARLESVHAARQEALAAIDAASRSANITAEDTRESVADAAHLASERTAARAEIAERAASAGLRPVVIGEQQDRVDYAARVFGAEPYPGLTAEAAGLQKRPIELEQARLAHNEAWLRQAIADGRIVIDTGPAEHKVDYPRPTEGGHGRGKTEERPYFQTAAYEMERAVADPYWRTVHTGASAPATEKSEDMRHTPWQDATGKLHVHTMDDETRVKLLDLGIDPATVEERSPWKFGPETYGAGLEGAPTRDLAPENAVPYERSDGAEPKAVRLDDGHGNVRAALQGDSDEARATRDQILEAHAREESVTLYRLVQPEGAKQRPFNDQLWTTYDPSSIALPGETVETRELPPGTDFTVGRYRGGTPIGTEVAVAPAAAPPEAARAGAELDRAERELVLPGPDPPPGGGDGGIEPELVFPGPDPPPGGGNGGGAEPELLLPGADRPPGGGNGGRGGGIEPELVFPGPDPPPGGGTGGGGEPEFVLPGPDLPPGVDPTALEQVAQAQAGHEQEPGTHAEQPEAARANVQEEPATKPQGEEAGRPSAEPEQEQLDRAQAQQDEATRPQAQRVEATEADAQQKQAAKAQAQQEQAAKAQAQQEQAAKAQAQQEQAAKTQAQQEQAAKEQAGKTQAQEEAAKAPTQEKQATKAQQEQAGKEQAAKTQAQQEQAAKSHAQQEEAAKAQAQQEQAAKVQQEQAARAQQEQAARAQQEQAARAQQEQAAKAQQEQAARAQQEQAAKAEQAQAQQDPAAKAQQQQGAKSQQEQAAKAQQEQAAKAQQEQAAKAQAQQEHAAKAQQEQATKAQQDQAAKAQQEQAAKAQQEQAAKAQAQQEQAAKAKAQQKQAAKAKAQQEQAAKAQAQQEQAAKAKAQQEQAAKAKAQQQEQVAKAKAQQEQVAKAKAQQEQTRQAAQQERSAKESNSRAAHQRESQQREAHQRRGQEAAARQHQRRQQETPQRGKQK